MQLQEKTTEQMESILEE